MYNTEDELKKFQYFLGLLISLRMLRFINVTPDFLLQSQHFHHLLSHHYSSITLDLQINVKITLTGNMLSCYQCLILETRHRVEHWSALEQLTLVCGLHSSLLDWSNYSIHSCSSLQRYNVMKTTRFQILEHWKSKEGMKHSKYNVLLCCWWIFMINLDMSIL